MEHGPAVSNGPGLMGKACYLNAVGGALWARWRVLLALSIVLLILTIFLLSFPTQVTTKSFDLHEASRCFVFHVDFSVFSQNRRCCI